MKNRRQLLEVVAKAAVVAVVPAVAVGLLDAESASASEPYIDRVTLLDEDANQQRRLYKIDVSGWSLDPAEGGNLIHQTYWVDLGHLPPEAAERHLEKIKNYILFREVKA
jgi:hypothetical protein